MSDSSAGNVAFPYISQLYIVIMPPPLIGGALSDDFVWRLYVCRVHRAQVENREVQKDQNWQRGSPRHT